MPTHCDPWPGKIKAIMRVSSILPARDFRRARDVSLHTLDEITLHESIRHRDGVANRLHRRASVTDDRQPGDAEQRRTAEFRVVNPALEAAERTAGQQVTNLTRERSLQFVSEQRLDSVDEPLARLQH